MIGLAATGVFLLLLGAFLGLCILTGLAAIRAARAVARWWHGRGRAA